MKNSAASDSQAENRPRRPRGRPRAFDRDLVLRHAAETFGRLGYEGASIVDLTAAMGITAQSLYGAFGSKAGLYREVLTAYRRTEGSFTARGLTEPSVLVAFERVLRESAQVFCRPDCARGCLIATAVLTCAEENREVAEHVAELRREARTAFQDRIERGIAEGDVAPGTDAAALAGFLAAMVQGMSVQARDGADAAALEAIAELALNELRRHCVASGNGS